jgi:hypothetical protein
MRRFSINFILHNAIKFTFSILIVFCFYTQANSQYTIVKGQIIDSISHQVLPNTKVQFLNTKTGTYSDSSGYFYLKSYYVSDTIFIQQFDYKKKKIKINIDQEQEITILLSPSLQVLNDIVILPPDEFPSTTLHKKIIANKKINNKEKLDAYEYESYNKFQIDINNIDERFKKSNLVQNLDIVMNFLDSTEDGKTYLPVFLSESISDNYFNKKPEHKIEIIKATKVSGFEQIQINQLLGEMYMDMNIYNNFSHLFQKDFVSPIANNARSFYRFYIEDSMYRDKYWCYKLKYVPKRYGDLTFEGDMWIHDTTFAINEISGKISPGANINYVQDLYFKQNFEQVEPDIWMLTNEEMIADLKLSENSKLYGFFARKKSNRKKFKINKPLEKEFYLNNNTIAYADSAFTRDSIYWSKNRHIPITIQEKGINKMIDSLNNTRYFGMLKKGSYLLGTGYYTIGKFEIGNISSLISTNPTEKIRFGIAYRTSNNFSKKIELSTKLAYGILDEKFKYGFMFRYNTSNKKRGLLSGFISSDIEQMGQFPGASTVGSTFNTLFRTGALDKLTFIEKKGITFEKDLKKDLILMLSAENKQLTALGLADYYSMNNTKINNLTTTEIGFKIRYAKDEEFISGVYERISINSLYPIFSLTTSLGIKNIINSQFNYQKVEFQIEQNRNLGSLGRFKYYINFGKYFGSTVYPFLKIHEGNQSYWLSETTFNLLNYYEFISDTYTTGMIEQHWEGLLFNRIPTVRKLKWRLVTGIKGTYGTLNSSHSNQIKLPNFTKRFNQIPYGEASFGVENIFKVFRIDFIWRLSHNSPSISRFGVRGKWTINF